MAKHWWVVPFRCVGIKSKHWWVSAFFLVIYSQNVAIKIKSAKMM
jgi:hypothetical protein